MEKETLRKAYEFKKKQIGEKGVWDKVRGELKDWYDFNITNRPKPSK
jgi:hypothetical protein